MASDESGLTGFIRRLPKARLNLSSAAGNALPVP
jgi:hypothetical protein